MRRFVPAILIVVVALAALYYFGLRPRWAMEREGERKACEIMIALGRPCN